MPTDKRAEWHISRLSRLSAARAQFESLWDDVTSYLMPYREPATGFPAPGQQQTSLIYDSTPTVALNILTSGLLGHLTSEAAPWFSLVTRNQDLGHDDTVQEWLLEVTRRMITTLSESNFYTAIQEFYEDLAGFGTAHIYQAADDRDVVRFYVFPPKEVYVAEDSRGVVDTHYRMYAQTVRQVAQQFGEESLNPDTRGRLANKPDDLVWIVHAVVPRETPGPALGGAQNLPWASIYMERDTRHVLSESGYYTDPWHTARWRKTSREVYGRGPAIDAMPDIKTLHEQRRTDLRAGQKAIEPPLMAPANMAGNIRMSPNAINYYMPGSRDRIEPLQTAVSLPFGLEMTADTREAVKRAFFVDVFLMLANQTAQMTATEVVERVQERLMILGPALGRLHKEALSPLVERTFNIMARAGLFPAPPAVLEGERLAVEYISPLAKALKAMEGQALQSALQFAQPFIALDPQAADVFDSDRAIRHAFELYGAPGEMLRPEAQVRRIREARARQQAVQAALDMGQQAGEMDRTAAEANRARGG